MKGRLIEMEKQPISKIKQLLNENLLSNEQIDELRKDERKGVQQLIRSYDRKVALFEKQKKEFLQLKKFDEQYKTNGQMILAGIDEAGRGPLAGPVVSAAVILPDDFECIGLTDSKQITEKKRNEFFELIKERAVAYAIAIVDHETIDRINILEATKLSMRQALEQLSIKPDITLIDAVHISVNHTKTVAINKGDAKSLSIAAASILAKVTRDQLMDKFHEKFPQYDFKNNKGYGSKKHLDALKRFGPSPIHRKSFSPVQSETSMK